MWLKYGLTPDNNLVAIEDVLSGKTDYQCFYCNGLLTATAICRFMMDSSSSGQTSYADVED